MSARGDTPIAFQPDTPILPGTISSAAEMVLYRAAQEALNNALRHASPSRVRVSLRQLPDSVLLKVADDGQGFAVPDQLDRLVLDGHLGLASLRQRIEHAGGALTIESAPGEGTTVRVTLPVPARQP